MTHTLKPYMVYSRFLTAQEGALLVFAHSFKEARVVGWRSMGKELTDSYLDFTAAILRNSDWLFSEADQEKLLKDIPHLIWNMKSCSQCEEWGHSEIGADGLCNDCREGETE
jgi:hypothetical protein